jgi:hypothetical protein
MAQARPPPPTTPWPRWSDDGGALLGCSSDNETRARARSPTVLEKVGSQILSLYHPQISEQFSRPPPLGFPEAQLLRGLGLKAGECGLGLRRATLYPAEIGVHLAYAVLTRNFRDVEGPDSIASCHGLGNETISARRRPKIMIRLPEPIGATLASRPTPRTCSRI